MPSAHLPLLSCSLAFWGYRAGGPEAAPITVSLALSQNPPRRAGYATMSKGQGSRLSFRTQFG